MTFEELCSSLTRHALSPQDNPMPSADPRQLDCLLHPERYAPVIRTKPCTHCAYERACQNSCIFDAISLGADGSMEIDVEKCTGCMACVQSCQSQNLQASRDTLPAIQAVRKEGALAYALIAPAFLGQFQKEVTPGKLRSAFKALGFQGMVEVALFADILTLKEALEFDKHILKDGDYQLTSCCCPIWIAMLRKVYKELMPHVPGSVSPMIACGRGVKKLHPHAVTVFIGPCVAKKSEAREKDLQGAIDYVLTFQEVQDLLKAAQIDPALLPETDRDHSSKAGRIYAKAGGVCEAVQATLARLHPHRSLDIHTQRADGVPACRAMIEALSSGEIKGNFYEGMGCVGGCVGGPKSLLPKEEGTSLVTEYGNNAPCETPLQNPYVLELLERLGITHVEELLEAPMFRRNF